MSETVGVLNLTLTHIVRTIRLVHVGGGIFFATSKQL